MSARSSWPSSYYVSILTFDSPPAMPEFSAEPNAQGGEAETNMLAGLSSPSFYGSSIFTFDSPSTTSLLSAESNGGSAQAQGGEAAINLSASIRSSFYGSSILIFNSSSTTTSVEPVCGSAQDAAQHLSTEVARGSLASNQGHSPILMPSIYNPAQPFSPSDDLRRFERLEQEIQRRRDSTAKRREEYFLRMQKEDQQLWEMRLRANAMPLFRSPSLYTPPHPRPAATGRQSGEGNPAKAELPGDDWQDRAIRAFKAYQASVPKVLSFPAGSRKKCHRAVRVYDQATPSPSPEVLLTELCKAILEPAMEGKPMSAIQVLKPFRDMLREMAIGACKLRPAAASSDWDDFVAKMVMDEIEYSVLPGLSTIPVRRGRVMFPPRGSSLLEAKLLLGRGPAKTTEEDSLTTIEEALLEAEALDITEKNESTPIQERRKLQPIDLNKPLPPVPPVEPEPYPSEKTASDSTVIICDHSLEDPFVEPNSNLPRLVHRSASLDSAKLQVLCRRGNTYTLRTLVEQGHVIPDEKLQHRTDALNVLEGKKEMNLEWPGNEAVAATTNPVSSDDNMAEPVVDDYDPYHYLNHRMLDKFAKEHPWIPPRGKWPTLPLPNVKGSRLLREKVQEKVGKVQGFFVRTGHRIAPNRVQQRPIDQVPEDAPKKAKAVLGVFN